VGLADGLDIDAQGRALQGVGDHGVNREAQAHGPDEGGQADGRRRSHAPQGQGGHKSQTEIGAGQQRQHQPSHSSSLRIVKLSMRVALAVSRTD
jgi:hypothetical protein